MDLLSPGAILHNKLQASRVASAQKRNEKKNLLALKKQQLIEALKLEKVEASGIGYDRSTGESLGRIYVRVKRARNLKSTDKSSSSVISPYALISVLGNKKIICPSVTTAVIPHTSFPSWEESNKDAFLFCPIETRIGSISIQVKNSDHTLLGHVDISFSKLLSQNPEESWYALRHEELIGASVLVECQFIFSNVIPLQLEILALEKEMNYDGEDVARKLELNDGEKPSFVLGSLCNWLFPEVEKQQSSPLLLSTKENNSQSNNIYATKELQ